MREPRSRDIRTAGKRKTEGHFREIIQFSSARGQTLAGARLRRRHELALLNEVRRTLANPMSREELSS